MAEKCPEDMAAGLRPFIQEAHAVVGQRHLARHGDVSAGNHPTFGMV
jgi:hypothetical protein